jgi:hypothetical protein
MKLKIFTCFLFIAFSVLLFAEETNALVAISADGAETSYVLSDVKRIEVSKKDASASMSVLLKDGTKEGSYQKIIFNKAITSIAELGEISFYVYPNPVVNTLNIIGVDENASLSVFNLNGQCIKQEKGNVIDVNALAKGTYILQINNQYVKFIKQ